MTSVAFLGLGAMGAPMALRIQKAGFPLTVWNRSAARSRPFEESGARVASTPREAAASADVVATMLSDPAAIDAVTTGESGLLAGLSAGKVWLDFSTVTPGDSRRWAAAARGRGAAFCDVPVAGSVIPAREGTLKILAGGDAAVLARVQPVLAAVSTTTIHVGPVGQGSAMKLVNNLAVAIALTGFGEALRLAGQLGIGAKAAADWLLSGVATAPYVKTKLDFLKGGGAPAHFTVALMEKDLRLAVSSGGEGLALAEAVRDAYREAIEAGLGAADFASIITHRAGRSAEEL